ncbi:MAG: hypothetical protein KGD57_07890 [Candidatus Lokiarchaeota archaeon]|nr:hypothetical protein [Candidatus Lokiarchaeota archaeon]
MQKICPQCGNINLPDDSFCKECIFELKEYNLEDFVIKEHHPEDYVIKEHQKGSLNIMVFIIIFIGFMILVTLVLITQYFVQVIIPLLIIGPIEIGFIL